MYEIKWYENPLFILPVLMLIIVVPIFLISNIANWMSAGVEVRLYNEMYGKNYTTAEFFWAGDTIKDYLNKGKQETINLNVDGVVKD